MFPYMEFSRPPRAKPANRWRGPFPLGPYACAFLCAAGEVFVLDDGGEVDLDLGNYERFLDIHLTKDNNLTTGKIYQYVINKERKGDYLGKTVQGDVNPHFSA